MAVIPHFGHDVIDSAGQIGRGVRRLGEATTFFLRPGEITTGSMFFGIAIATSFDNGPGHSDRESSTRESSPGPPIHCFRRNTIDGNAFETEIPDTGYRKREKEGCGFGWHGIED
jgi:hypothetical protein